MNKEQFHGWQNLPVTIEIMAKLEEIKAGLSDRLSSGQTLSTTAGETALLTARIIGNIEGINQLLRIDYEEEKEEE